MCFVVNSLAPKWRNRVVYKITMVRKRKRGRATRLVPPQFDDHHRIDYRPKGRVHAITRSLTISSNGCAVAGFYVFKSRKDAVKYWNGDYSWCTSPQLYRIVKLRVQREDFLHSSGGNLEVERATYRKVTNTGVTYKLRKPKSV